MCEVIYKAVIPLDPKTKKNNLVIKYRKGCSKGLVYKKTPYGFVLLGVPFIAQGDIYKLYETNCAYWLKRPKNGPINEPVNVRCLFYRDSIRNVDLPNLENAICDILTEYHVIADDNRNIVYSMDGSRVFYDKDNPRTEIYITKAEDGAKKWTRNRKGEKKEL